MGLGFIQYLPGELKGCWAPALSPLPDSPPTPGEQEMRQQQLWPCAPFPLPHPCAPLPWVPLLGPFPRGLVLMKPLTFPLDFH